jgi:hypothetical protein
VGLIKTENVSEARKRRFYQKTREGLVSGSLWDNPDTLDELQDGHECTALSSCLISRLLTLKVRDNVSIDALCLFDTVASLGVPKAGAGTYIAPILRMVPPFRKDYAHFESIVRCPPKGKICIRPPTTPVLFSLIHVQRFDMYSKPFLSTNLERRIMNKSHNNSRVTRTKSSSRCGSWGITQIWLGTLAVVGWPTHLSPG